MMSKTIFFICALVALTQNAYGQCANSYISQPIVSLGSCGCGNNLALSNGVVGAGALGYGASILAPGFAQSNDVFSVVSGSATTPNGISVITDNLELAGPIAVSGTLPFTGAVGLSGAMSNAGQASVSYSSAPGVGITSAGCGQGVTGVANNAIIGAPGLSVYGNNAILSNNLAGRGLPLGGCGCY